MRPYSKIIALAGALALAGCASAVDTKTGTESVPTPVAITPVSSLASLSLTKPIWRVGDEWHYSDDYTLRVTAVNGPMTRMERLDVPDSHFINNGFFREVQKSEGSERRVVFRSEDPDQFYALPMGRPLVFVREYLRDKQLIRHQTSWVVESKERITVPAGTFDTFVIVMRTRSLSSDWTGYERWWYAPAVRNYVRMEYKYGQAPENARVLLKFTVGQ